MLAGLGLEALGRRRAGPRVARRHVLVVLRLEAARGSLGQRSDMPRAVGCPAAGANPLEVRARAAPIYGWRAAATWENRGMPTPLRSARGPAAAHRGGHRAPPAARRPAPCARTGGAARAPAGDRRLRPPSRVHHAASRDDDGRADPSSATPAPAPARARAARPLAGLRHRQGRRGQDDGGGGARPAAAARGRRTVVCDLAGSDQLARAYGGRDRAVGSPRACGRSRSTPRTRSRSGCAASPAARRRSRCSRARRRSRTSSPPRPARRSS